MSKLLLGGITNRHRYILKLICDGMANKQIADHLGISENTVKNHMKEIFKRLKCKCRAQAAVRYLRG
jgi:DNA-binding NarL/FixJ family response regulator